MKNLLKLRLVFLVLTSVFFVSISFQNLNAQNTKKSKVRLKADYVKIMDSEIYLNLTASAKINKQNTKVSGIELIVYNELDEEKIKLGSTITNIKGESKFLLGSLTSLKPDSTNTYKLTISFKGNDSFKKASKKIKFKNANIEAKIITKDSLNYITATLTDASTNSPIMEESLSVQVLRYFRGLQIGEEFNFTDNDGTIIVPIEEGIPGVDGSLNFEVVLNDSDDYGTIKALIKAPLGVPIVDESTYNQRTLWSPRNKTPLFILVFTNILILGMWSIIIYLIINLFKISKSKIQ